MSSGGAHARHPGAHAHVILKSAATKGLTGYAFPLIIDI